MSTTRSPRRRRASGRSRGAAWRVVLPYGSRVATSRINFRLLARDALTHGKRLVDRAPRRRDPGPRRVGRPAGLRLGRPSTRRRWDRAPMPSRRRRRRAGGRPEPRRGGRAAPSPRRAAARWRAPRPGRRSSRRRRDRPCRPAATRRSAAERPRRPRRTRRRRPPRPPRAGTARRRRRDLAEPRRSCAAATAAAGRRRTAASAASARLDRGRGRGAAGRRGAWPPAHRRASVPTSSCRRPTIAVTPADETVGPIAADGHRRSRRDRADADRAGRARPRSVTRRATANDTFPATGKRVEETPGEGRRSGSATTTSRRSNTIPAGSIVSTQTASGSRPTRAVTVPGPTWSACRSSRRPPTSRSPRSRPGTDGNVEPNTIVVIPKGEDPISLDVTNPDETTGGKHDEFPKVTRRTSTRRSAALEPAAPGRLRGPARRSVHRSPGADGLPGDRRSWASPRRPSTRPRLVGQEVHSFDLGLNATGTVTAVTRRPSRPSRQSDCAPRSTADHRLVEDSIKVDGRTRRS